MRVGGRLEKTDLPHSTKYPVILHHSSHIVKLLCLQVHKTSVHPSPGALQAILAQDFLITGARCLAKEISKHCVPCQKAYARTKNQLMGQLPPDRATPSPPFLLVLLFEAIRESQHRSRHTFSCLYVSVPRLFTWSSAQTCLQRPSLMQYTGALANVAESQKREI